MQGGEGTIISKNAFVLQNAEMVGIWENSEIDAIVTKNRLSGTAFTGVHIMDGDNWVVEKNRLCSLAAANLDQANIILEDTVNTLVEKNHGQAVKQVPFNHPSNQIEKGRECGLRESASI